MPKMRSRSGVKKRFKVTASGKLKRHHSNASHLLTKKNAKRKRHLRASDVVAPEHHRRIRKLIIV